MDYPLITIPFTTSLPQWITIGKMGSSFSHDNSLKTRLNNSVFSRVKPLRGVIIAQESSWGLKP